MPGVSLEEAIDLVREAGFQVFEVVTGGFDGVVGSPAVDSPGVWPRALDSVAVDRLRKRLAVFDEVVVHAGHLDVNIASDNPGIREESVQQYLQTFDLGVALGARRITFHPGFPSRINSHPDKVIARCVEFGRLVARRAADQGVLCGYENVGTIPGTSMGGLTQDQLLVVLEAVGSSVFGLHFDVGWAVRTGGILSGGKATETVLESWLQRFKGRIVSVHLHGVLATTPFGVLHHIPVHLDNVVDYTALMQMLAEAAPGCPIVFEPLARHAREAIALSQKDLAFLSSIS
jgi:sugar phosphate isomerase/epimerase